MAKTKKCKYCQSEIDKKATVCPVCKRTIKGHGCLVIVFIVLIIFCATIYGTFSINDAVQKEVSGVSEDSEYITLDEFNEIQTGMTYEQVVAIIGSSGTPSVQTDGEGMSYQIYTWYGNGVAGSNANVTFINGEVSAKAQVGLK